MLVIFCKPARSVVGPATISALERGKGTNDEVKGVEPEDCGTFGLLIAVLLLLFVSEPDW